MDRSFRTGLILLTGAALLGTALALQAILLETVVWTVLLAGVGALLATVGGVLLRAAAADTSSPAGPASSDRISSMRW